jgi:hypothetical protein
VRGVRPSERLLAQPDLARAEATRLVWVALYLDDLDNLIRTLQQPIGNLQNAGHSLRP